MLLLPSMLLSLAALAAAKINWHTDCKYIQAVSSSPIKCANFSVPLDYTDSKSKKTLNLTVVRADAVKQPVKGSIFFNPGGPGDSAVQFVAGGIAELMTITGGHYNLIGFDSRGVNNTIPYSCFKPGQQDPYQILSGNASDNALGESFANAQIQAAVCKAATKDIGGLVGTAFVARDMARLVDALGEDGMLRYWGLSYGTALGATFSAMFPGKVDKVLLDGNVDIHDYYAGTDVSTTSELDIVVEGFYSGCVSSPNCALAKMNQTAEELANTIDSLLENLKYNPIGLFVQETPLLIDYTHVKSVMFSSMYSPLKWPVLSEMLQSMIIGNMTEFVELYVALGGAAPTSQALLGIRCGDTAIRAENVTSLEPLIAGMTAASQWGGLDFGPSTLIACATWQQKAKEIYSGSWKVKTKNPLLFIGSGRDPVTPLSSAMANSANFSGSVVLQHNGYGHTSLAQLSLCTAKAVQAYFNKGVLPAAGTVCQPSIPLFSNVTWEEALAPISLNGTTKAKDKREEGVELLGSMERLGKLMRRRTW